MGSSFVITVDSHHGRKITRCESTWTKSDREVDSRYVVEGVHGVGVVRSEFVTDIRSAQNSLQAYRGEPESIGESIRGSLALYVHDRWHNRRYLLVDPFGACIIHKISISGVMFYASDLPYLLRILAHRGIKIEKNLNYSMAVVLTGSGGMVSSSYHGVDTLAPFTYVQFDYEGATEKQYPFLNGLINDTSDVDATIEAYLEDVSININAAANYESPIKISQLTGGMDSRLVLGHVVNAGLQDVISFYVGGSEQSLDVRAARSLCSRLGLRMTKYSGIDRSISPSGVDELLWPLHETSGILQGPADAGLARNENVVLSGGYGEVLRSFYSKNRNPDVRSSDSILRQMYGEFGHPTKDSSGLWNNDFLESVGETVTAKIDHAKNLGIPEHFQLDYLYLTGRNRYFVGEISRSMSQYTNRFDPLYSPLLLALACKSSAQERHDGTLQLSILHKLSSGLVSQPFDTPRVSDQFARDHGLDLIESFDATPPEFDARNNFAPLESGNIDMSIDIARLKQRALEINMPYHLIRDAEFCRMNLDMFIDKVGESVISQNLNLDRLKEFSKSQVKWRPQVRLLRSLGTNLAWLTLDS